jgi:hypothetical protein
VDGVSEPDDLGGQASPAGFEDPALGLREAGEIEGQEFVESALGLREAVAEVARGGAEGRRRRGRRGGGAAGVAEQRLARGDVGGGVPGGEHGLGLAGTQAVARDRVGQALLIAPRHAGERGGRGGGEAAGVDVRSDLGGQAPAEGEPAIDPRAATPEQLDDLRGREVIVVGEGAHHARLVHRAQRAPGRVGFEQARLGDHAGGVFDHDGHVGGAVAGPLRQALEAVDHLVRAGGGGRHAQRQRGQGARDIGAGSAQGRQRRRELGDRELLHGRHGCAGGSSGSTW